MSPAGASEPPVCSRSADQRSRSPRQALARAPGGSAEGSSCQPLHSFSRRVGTAVSSRPHNRLRVNSIRSWISWQRAAQLVSAAARNRAVFPPVPASAALGCSRLFSGNFSVGVNLLHLGLSNSRFSINFDQKQQGSCVRERNS